jgi:hypothetical protein
MWRIAADKFFGTASSEASVILGADLLSSAESEDPSV